MRGALVAGALSVLALWSAGRAMSETSRMRLLRRAGLAFSHKERGSGRLEILGVRARGRFSPAGRAALGAAGLAFGLLLGGPPLALCGFVAALAVPGVLASRRNAKQLALLEAQLAEAVGATAAALRSGLSLSQSVRFAAEEGVPPVSKAMLRVAEREALGVPLEDSLEQWVLEDGTRDVRLVASVLQLHHRVGGDSPVVLDQVSRTLRLRRAAARELRSLTAQARLSGAVLGLLPVGFFAFMSVVSRSDIQAAFRSPAGLASIVLGLVLDGGAFLWIRKLLEAQA